VLGSPNCTREVQGGGSEDHVTQHDGLFDYHRERAGSFLSTRGHG